MNTKIIAIILILSALSLSVENVEFYNGKFAIVSENYVLQLPQSLAEKAILNHDFLISLVPSVKVNGQTVTIAPSINQDLLSRPKSSFSFQVASEKEGIRIEEKIKIEEKQISSDVTIRNKKSEEIKVTSYYPVNTKNEKTVFIPDLFTDKEENYFIFLNQNLEGNALGVTFSTPMNLENQQSFLINTSSYGITSKETTLKTGQSINIKAVYYPFNFQTKKEATYPLSEASHLENIFIDTIGETEEVGTGLSDKIDQILKVTNSIEKEGAGDFIVFHTVDLNNPKDSLDFAMYFKKMAEKTQLPTKLIIAKKGQNYYAWVKAYFGKWVDIDVFSGQRKQPKDISPVYIEPTIEMHNLRNKSETPQDLYLSSNWLKSTQQNKFLTYFIILIVIAIGIVGFITLKAGTLTKKLKVETIEKQNLGGKYKILKKEKITDPFINDIFKKTIEKEGEIDLNKMAEEFHYSKDLVSFAVAYLIDNDFIKKEGELTTEYTQKPKKKTIEKKQLIKIIAIVGIAIVLIILLLII